MNFRVQVILIFTFLISGCGLTGGQKAQVQSFSKATSVAIDASSGKIVDIRNAVIEIRKERIILGDLDAHYPLDLDTKLDPDKIAVIVATMRLIKDYANALDKLSSSDQSESIRKAVSNLSTSINSAAKTFSGGTSSISISNEHKEVAAGVAAKIGQWFIEKKKKDAIIKLVDTYYPLVNKLAEHINHDISLIGNSPCWPKFRNGAKPGTTPMNQKKKSGTLDIYCTQANSLRQHTQTLIKCPIPYNESGDNKFCSIISVEIRERALNDYLKMNHDMDNLAEFSKKAEKLVDKLVSANNKLPDVLDKNDITAKEIKEHAASVKELATLVEVLTGK